MADRILTTHAGSLPRPLALTGLYARSAQGGEVNEAELSAAGRDALFHIIKQQAENGVDIANNGEQQREAFFFIFATDFLVLVGVGHVHHEPN